MTQRLMVLSLCLLAVAMGGAITGGQLTGGSINAPGQTGPGIGCNCGLDSCTGQSVTYANVAHAEVGYTGSGYDIVFGFTCDGTGPGNDDCYCGQYIDETYWVMDDGISLTEPTPVSTGSEGSRRHGSQVNVGVTVVDYERVMTGWDGRYGGGSYSFDDSLNPTYPLAPDTSDGHPDTLLKAISLQEGTNPICDECTGTDEQSGDLTVLRRVRPLTVLPAGEQPLSPDELFRPSYWWDEKRNTEYRWGDLHASRKAELGVRSTVGLDMPDRDCMLTRHFGFQLELGMKDWMRSYKPRDDYWWDCPQMGGSAKKVTGYYAYMAQGFFQSALWLQTTDYDEGDADDKRIFVSLLQTGLDIAYSRLSSNAANNSFVQWATHSGGKLEMAAFAGFLFDDSDIQTMLDVPVDPTDSDWITHRAYGLTNGASEVLWGTDDPTEDQYWDCYDLRGPPNAGGSCDFQQFRDPYGFVDGGSDDDGGNYVTCCYALPAMPAALWFFTMTGGKAWVQYDPFFDWVDRWQTTGGFQMDPDPCSGWAVGGTSRGTDYGEDSGDPGDCIRPADGGNANVRFPGVDGTGADGVSHMPFAEDFWDTYR